MPGVEGSNKWPPCSSTMRQQALSERVGGLFPASPSDRHGDARVRDGERSRRIVSSEVYQHKVALTVCADLQGGVRFAIEMVADLRGKVHAHAEDLVRVGEHRRKGIRQIEADERPSASRWGVSRRAAVCNTELMSTATKPCRRLTGKSEQVRNQRVRVPDLFADLPGLNLFVGWQIGCAEQIRVSEHRSKRVVDFVRGAADQSPQRG